MALAAEIRPAIRSDVSQLLALEERCFESDRLSRRSFHNFIKPGAHTLLVIGNERTVSGYVLILYRAGTNLARLYSIAVAVTAQGKGLSKRLLSAAEEAAGERHCVFMRLEVSVRNQRALQLYLRYGYRQNDLIRGYYENGDDAVQMEKRLHLRTEAEMGHQPYYQQTTDFTCGPASLMMVLKTVRPDYRMTRREELQIWREATTIFMTSGHGGCSPYGLALSAWHRGFGVTLYINERGTPFLDGVRDQQKKSVIQLVHEDFIGKIEETEIRVEYNPLEGDELDRILDLGLPIVALISTWRLDRKKAPHWVYVSGCDEKYVYINDSDNDYAPHLTQSDYTHVPIERAMFRGMACFGQKRLRSLLVIHGAVAP
ncbi:MAG: GNAT family N-acetyltransferase/peptidase C39 family protein [Gammaproteobacteria bacterium]|nr:GNAT family N-acetyltransferase/peptidase C39 family protein [Gammaproteobacteria bacterium]